MHAFRASCVLLAALALAVAGRVDVARAASGPSDRLLISDPTGLPIFDNSLPETATAPETSLTFAGGPTPVSPPPIPISSAITIPGVSIVVLTEPAGTTSDPGEPPLILPGPGGDIFVSDVVVSTLPVAGIPAFITLLSDGDPELQQILPILGTTPGLRILPETGTLQNLTSLVVGNNTQFGPITVQVQSDVAPEPGMLLLLGSGLALVQLARRTRRNLV
jgi:hypothetical protein